EYRSRRLHLGQLFGQPRTRWRGRVAAGDWSTGLFAVAGVDSASCLGWTEILANECGRGAAGGMFFGRRRMADWTGSPLATAFAAASDSDFAALRHCHVCLNRTV